MEDESVYRQRFENLIKAVEDGAARRTRFDMITWGYRFRGKVQEEQSEDVCGTPACALGHYASRRDLQQEFKLDRYGNVRTIGGYDGYDATKNHFGINSDEFRELFGPGGCGQAFTSRKLALRWLKKFVHDRFYKPKDKEQDDVAV